MPNLKVARKRAIAAASRVLRDPDASKAAKSAARSALHKAKLGRPFALPDAGIAASKILRSNARSKASKMVAGSALTRRNDSN